MEDMILGGAFLCFLVVAYFKLSRLVKSYLEARSNKIAQEFQELSNLLKEAHTLHNEAHRKLKTAEDIEAKVLTEANQAAAVLVTREEEMLNSIMERKEVLLKKTVYSMQQEASKDMKALLIKTASKLALQHMRPAELTEGEILVLKRVLLSQKHSSGLH